MIDDIVKPVFKGHSRKPENMAFMSSWPLYTGVMYAERHFSELTGQKSEIKRT
jgi:hypothetical protein